jgi:hypothetical protein
LCMPTWSGPSKNNVLKFLKNYQVFIFLSLHNIRLLEREF